jgi:alanine racemase
MGKWLMAKRDRSGSFDPWVEVIADAVRHNVRELHRYTGRRLVAVAKNNANGIGLRQIGPVLDGLDEVDSIAVVRVDEALALRTVGVKKPILMMAHVADSEAELLVRNGVRLSPSHDDASSKLTALADRVGHVVPVHPYVDTGMNRLGMPYQRAVPWMVDLAANPAVSVEGTYTMFSGAIRDGAPFDLEHLRRFQAFLTAVREQGVDPGLVHGAASYQLVHTHELHELDLIRPGGAIYGLDAYRRGPDGEHIMDLQPVFRLRARVARVERVERGEGVSFEHRYRATEPTWVATLPIGHTDGYPRDAAGNAQVLINDRLYPVIGVVSSNHTIVEIGAQKSVCVGDTATLVGPDRDEITPIALASATGLERDYWVMTRLSALLHREVVS